MGGLEIDSGAGDIMGRGSDIAAKVASGYGPRRFGVRSELAEIRLLRPSLSAKTALDWGVAKR